MSTEDLQSIEGIGDTTAEKLIGAGISNVVSLASTTVAKLVAIGLTKANANKILGLARERCSGIFGFVSGEELIKQYGKRQYLTSGSKDLDGILYVNKGFQTQKLYEIYGPEGTGKSTLLHQLICTAYLPPDKGGLGAGAIYIDTEGSFSMKRIEEIAPRFGIDPAEITRSVIKSSPPTSDVLLYLCETELEKMASETGARLFCLDSIATHFRSEYGTERQCLPERQQKANKVVHALKRVAQQMNGVAIMTNQVSANVTGMGRPWQHSMGFVIGHEAHVRIRVSIKSTSEALRLLTIEKALDLPPNECILQIDTTGFLDVEQPAKTSKKAKGKAESEGEVKVQTKLPDAKTPEPKAPEAKVPEPKAPEATEATTEPETATKTKSKKKTKEE